MDAPYSLTLANFKSSLGQRIKMLSLIEKINKTKVGKIIAVPIDKKLLTTDISELLEDKFYCSVTGREIEDYAYWSPDTFRIYSSKSILITGLKQYKTEHDGVDDSIDDMEKRAVKYSKIDLKKNKLKIINKSNSYRPKEC